MTPEQFCYWLQGYCEGRDAVPPDAEKWRSIVDHLDLVFKKETPVRTSRRVGMSEFPQILPKFFPDGIPDFRDAPQPFDPGLDNANNRPIC